MDCHFLNPVHLEIVCNYVLLPYKEGLKKNLLAALKQQFQGQSRLNILFVGPTGSTEAAEQTGQHVFYYLRSLKTLNLLTKYHLASLMGSKICSLINLFGRQRV